MGSEMCIRDRDHLGGYGDSIEDVPGIVAYFGEKVNKVKVTSTDDSIPLYVPLLVIGAIGAVVIILKNRESETKAPESQSSASEE